MTYSLEHIVSALKAAREENSSVQICSLVRGSDAGRAVREAINSRAQFIQMSDK